MTDDPAPNPAEPAIPATLETLTSGTATRAALEAAASELYGLLAAREAAFGVHPSVVKEEPDVSDPPSSAFLVDPVADIEARLARLARRTGAGAAPISRVVILTTFADRLAGPLARAGYAVTPIDLPAGPDHTAAFECAVQPDPAAGAAPSRAGGSPARTLYLEAVNESDPKIAPTVALVLRGPDGAPLAGACGSAHARDGTGYAWLSVLTVADGQPAGRGRQIADAAFDLLRAQGVRVVHVGTQTAAGFYRRLGFHNRHALLPALRERPLPDGTLAPEPLAILEMTL